MPEKKKCNKCANTEGKVDYTDLIPKMLIETPKTDSAYREAYLDRNEKSNNKFCQNTTTWD